MGREQHAAACAHRNHRTELTMSSKLTPSLAGDRHRLLLAEAVLPGHPDKLADQIADAIVDIALQRDERAIVQVEVAVDRSVCFVDGRCSTAGGPLPKDYVEATV